LPRQAVGRELLLRGEERALRVEIREKGVRARLVARFGERVVALRRRHIVAIRLHLIDVRSARRQCVRHFLERGPNRAFVVRHLDLLLDLDFARETADASPNTSVDAQCRRHYGDSLADDALVRFDLQAGDGFGLPLVDLDRVLTTLIENALTYCEMPVEIATLRHDGHYALRVRDHGSGTPGNQLGRALQPFVRLDEARSGDAHCGLGLGLAIVRPLVRYNGGGFHADNDDDGGFAVSMTFRA
jgi:signal transduction histidine kinase